MHKIFLILVLVVTTSCASSTEPLEPEKKLESQIDLDSPTFFRLVEGNIERRSTSGRYFSTDSRIGEDFSQIRGNAYTNFNNFMRRENSNNLAISVVIRPGVPKELADYSIAQIKGAALFWDYLFHKGSKLDILLVTEKDSDYMENAGRDYVTNLDSFNRIGQIDKNYGNTWIMGEVRSSRSSSRFKSKLILATPSFATTDRMQNGWIQVPAHEIFHVIFDYYMSQRPVQSEDEYFGRAPQHFIEGGANYFSYSYAMKNLGWYSDGLDVSLSLTWRNLESWKPVRNEADIVNLLIATENSWPQPAFEASYSVGAIFLEWIVGKYGMEALKKILENLAMGISFDANLKSSIGLSKEEAYRMSAPYLLSIFERLGLD
jgi:hypothetical protein